MWCLKEKRKHVFKGAGTWCLIKTNNFPRLSDLFRFMGYLHAKLSFLWCSLFYFLQSSLCPCFLHSFLSFIPSSGLASFVVSSFLFCWICLPPFFLSIFPYFVILSSSLFCRSSCFNFIFFIASFSPLFLKIFFVLLPVDIFFIFNISLVSLFRFHSSFFLTSPLCCLFLFFFCSSIFLSTLPVFSVPLLFLVSFLIFSHFFFISYLPAVLWVHLCILFMHLIHL